MIILTSMHSIAYYRFIVLIRPNNNVITTDKISTISIDAN